MIATLPSFPTTEAASPTTFGVVTSTVTSAELAIIPRVMSAIGSSASSAVANMWVAPNRPDCSRLNGDGSIAMIRLAPAIRAP